MQMGLQAARGTTHAERIEEGRNQSATRDSNSLSSYVERCYPRAADACIRLEEQREQEACVRQSALSGASLCMRIGDARVRPAGVPGIRYEISQPVGAPS
eukprot:667769-Pleurochrysis_carterae.AAC.5